MRIRYSSRCLYLTIVFLSVFYVSWFLIRLPTLTLFSKVKRKDEPNTSITEQQAKSEANIVTESVLDDNGHPKVSNDWQTMKKSMKEREHKCSEELKQLTIEIGDLRKLRETWLQKREELNMAFSPAHWVEQVASSIREGLLELRGDDKRVAVRLQSLLRMLETRGSGNMELKRDKVVAGSRELCAERVVHEEGRVDMKRYGIYRAGNCSALPHLRDLVTVLLEWGPNPIGPLRDVVGALKKAYGDIQVMVSTESASDAQAARRGLQDIPRASVINEEYEDESIGPGSKWNAMVERVETRLALLLRDVANFSAADAALPRLVRVLALLSQVDIVGGAYRNATGHWRFGCHQTTVRNGHLHYSEGYRHSAEGCAYCHHVSGSFVVRTSLLKSVRFSKTLPSHVLFEDWFLRIKERDALAMVCPDSMFLTRSHATDVALRPLSSPARSAWLPLARAHGLSSVHVPPRVRARYSCSEVGIECRPFEYFGQYLAPTCCFKQFAQSLDILESLRRLKHLDYVLASGSQLAAIKSAGPLPWRLQGTFLYDRDASKSFLELRTILKTHRIELKYLLDDIFRWYTPEIYLEFRPTERGKLLNRTDGLPEELTGAITLIQMLGRWVPAQPNPGQYSRNMYGPGHLTHATWQGADRVSAEKNHPLAGLWPSCPTSGENHTLPSQSQAFPTECLDRYPTDGSVDFAPLYFNNMDFDWENEF